MWEASKDSILTTDSLMKREKVSVNGCYMYKCQAEACSHILLFCPAVQHIWSMIYGLLEVSWIKNDSVREEI